jgi:catechol 2,3-dioxygenase-like lactoylglutathione lyase family enzyme
MIKEIAFVGYPVKDVKKARAFYEDLLGLTPSDEFGSTTDESVFIEYNIGSSTLSIGKMDGWNPSPDGPNAALEVDNFDELMTMLKEKGVTIVLEPQTFPNCKMAVVRDPDGNQVTIHQRNS